MTRSTNHARHPRLLALDIDGTLLDSHGRLPGVVRDAVQCVAAGGVQVVLATGRSPWYGVAEIAQALGLGGTQLTMQGALAMDPRTGRIDRARPLDSAVYLDALELAGALDIEPVVATPAGHRAARPVAGVDFVERRPGANRLRIQRDLRTLADDHPMRVYLPTGPARHHAVRLAMAGRFLGRAAVVWSDLEGVELIAHGINKGEAIEWLAARRGIALADVAAVGDAWNDTEMLRVAGRSAAMGTAPDEVRAAADIVVPDSDDAGLVDALAWLYPELIGVVDRRTPQVVAGERLGVHEG